MHRYVEWESVLCWGVFCGNRSSGTRRPGKVSQGCVSLFCWPRRTVTRPSSASSTICAGLPVVMAAAFYICFCADDSGLDGFRCQTRSQKPFSGWRWHGTETERAMCNFGGPSSPVRSKLARMRSSGAAPVACVTSESVRVSGAMR